MPTFRILFEETELRVCEIDADNEHAARQVWIDDGYMLSTLVETTSSTIIDFEELT